LTSLGANLFANNPALVYLFLRGNRLVSLPATLFQKNTQLQQLLLSNNSLTALDKNQFANNKQLSYITFQNNKLNAIFNTTFSGLTNLKNLNLSGNACIDKDFDGATATTIMGALAKCDTNANTNPAPNCDKYVTAIKNLSGMISSTITALANLSQALTQITKI
jgi:hypothetical protein